MNVKNSCYSNATVRLKAEWMDSKYGSIFKWRSGDYHPQHLRTLLSVRHASFNQERVQHWSERTCSHRTHFVAFSLDIMRNKMMLQITSILFSICTEVEHSQVLHSTALSHKPKEYFLIILTVSHCHLTIGYRSISKCSSFKNTLNSICYLTRWSSTTTNFTPTGGNH